MDCKNRPHVARWSGTRCIILAAFALGSLPAWAQSAEELQQPFAVLREAYRLKDAGKATQAYTGDARIAFQYPGMPREEYVGTIAIKKAFEQILQPIKPEWSLAMNFKLARATPGSGTREGLYHIIVAMGDRSTHSYGRFTVILRAEGGAWRFSEDISEIATQADYEALSEPELFMD
jgi:ketosteroid isomerase-like protein